MANAGRATELNWTELGPCYCLMLGFQMAVQVVATQFPCDACLKHLLHTYTIASSILQVSRCLPLPARPL